MQLPTPLVPLPSLGQDLYAKIECQHASGSMKHRSIPFFLQQLRRTGELSSGQRIAIRSAGSAAVTAAWASAQLRQPMTAVLPPTATQHTARLLEWLGAECRQLPASKATKTMNEFTANPDVFVLAQATEARLIDYYQPVAAEISESLPEAAAITVGIGTGLSATGIARGLRKRGHSCSVYGVEPAEAAIASGQPWSPHNIPGLAPPIPQPLLEKELLNGIVPVLSAEAWQQAQEVGRCEGLLLGPSSGATIAAALHLRKQGIQGPIVAICACSMLDYTEGIPVH